LLIITHILDSLAKETPLAYATGQTSSDMDYHAGDMTTEEYQVICNKLLGNYPDDVQTIITLSQDESAADCFKGTLIVSWQNQYT
jgi:hypothetical protein